MPKKERKFKEVKVTINSEIIKVSADELWEIAKEFDKASLWVSSLKNSEASGKPEFEGAPCKERVCNTYIKGYERVVEKLTLFSNENKELAYEMTEGKPDFLYFAGNHWRIYKTGPNQSRIQMNLTMHMSKFLGFFVARLTKKKAIQEVYKAINDLKIFAEAGTISLEKKNQLKKDNKAA